MNIEMFERIAASVSDLSMPITLQQFEWAEISQGTISEELKMRIIHQVNMQIADHLNHLSLAEKRSLLYLSGWQFVGTKFIPDSPICIYCYQKAVDGITYKTEICVEAEQLPLIPVA